MKVGCVMNIKNLALNHDQVYEEVRRLRTENYQLRKQNEKNTRVMNQKTRIINKLTRQLKKRDLKDSEKVKSVEMIPNGKGWWHDE
jgi:hypothetical protein